MFKMIAAWNLTRKPTRLADMPVMTGFAGKSGALALFILCSVQVCAAQTAGTSVSGDATVTIFNRDIMTFRAALMDIPAGDRARRAKARIEDQLAQPGEHKVSIAASPLGPSVQIDGKVSFVVTAGDLDPFAQEKPENAAKRVGEALTAAIEASEESRSLQSVLKSAGMTLAFTLAALTLLWVLKRTRRAGEALLSRLTQRISQHMRWSNLELMHRERIASVVHLVIGFMFWWLVALLAYEWLSMTLAQFPYTRLWGEQLNGYLVGLLAQVARGMVDAVPGLFTVVVIFFIGRAVTQMVDSLAQRVQTGQTTLSWLDKDVVTPTRRITKTIIWLFALTMAYPYLPGSGTDAFKGLSVLLGVMISLGSTNLVGQAGSGLILTYARVFRAGEYVRIGEHEGTITDLGFFVTRFKTGLGEEVTLSNTTVLGSVTKNYSRAAQGAGYVMDTVVTIGYDTPWRQVHAMLTQAATRTVGVMASPAPLVFQTALTDFYPEYRLVCLASPTEPRPRAMLLSALHQNIQDVFNEYGVQIMSPHYFNDPHSAKTVPAEKWFAPPSKRPDENSGA
jgi:small-conductance mechanosensitive channel